MAFCCNRSATYVSWIEVINVTGGSRLALRDGGKGIRGKGIRVS